MKEKIDRSHLIDRKQMIEEDIKKRGINGKRILQAKGSIPRHKFVSKEYQDIAYRDSPLPIGFCQTISQPYIVALMISMLMVSKLDRVLEIGTGCGYQTAILANLVKHVFSVEIIPELAEKAKATLSQLQINNVTITTGDGSCGWKENAPYDGILVSAAAPSIHRDLLHQLGDGARLVAPVGNFGYQILETWIQDGPRYKKETGIPVSFVPLLGKYGTEKAR